MPAGRSGAWVFMRCWRCSQLRSRGWRCDEVAGLGAIPAERPAAGGEPYEVAGLLWARKMVCLGPPLF